MPPYATNVSDPYIVWHRLSTVGTPGRLKVLRVAGVPIGMGEMLQEHPWLVQRHAAMLVDRLAPRSVQHNMQFKLPPRKAPADKSAALLCLEFIWMIPLDAVQIPVDGVGAHTRC